MAALAAKEDVALTTGLWMVLYWLAARRFALPRAHFAAGLALSLAVFFVNLKLVLPHYKLATCLWLDPLAAVGTMDSVPAAPAYKEVLESWYKPAFLAERFLRREALSYALAPLLWPVAFFLRRPTWLWLGPLAGVFVNAILELEAPDLGLLPLRLRHLRRRARDRARGPLRAGAAGAHGAGARARGPRRGAGEPAARGASTPR